MLSGDVLLSIEVFSFQNDANSRSRRRELITDDHRQMLSDSSFELGAKKAMNKWKFRLQVMSERW